MPSQVKVDILRWKPLRVLTSWPGFPVVLQAAALGFVAVLVASGLGIGPGMSAGDLMTLRKTNLTTLVVWGLWWPGMIAVALVFGRAWCTLCPMEFVNRMGDSMGRKLGLPRARLGKLLRSGFFVALGYLTLQLLVAGLSIHRVPHLTAILLLVLIGVALAAGLVFREPRSFCRALCPASALLAVYGRHTPLQLEVREASVCATCPTKDCIRAENRHRLDRRSCPSLLRPFNRQPSDGCLVCLQCAKVCPYGNVGVGLVARDAPIRRKMLLRPFEAAFVMVALGFVSHEVVAEVKWLDTFFHRVPNALGSLTPSIPPGWFEAAWFLLLFPLAVWALIGGAGYLAGHRAGLRSLVLGAATGAAPVVAVAHLAKAAAKLTSWGGFLPLALRDPRGVDTLHRLTDQPLAAPASPLGLSVVGWVMLALTGIMAWKGGRWVRQLPADSVAAGRAGMAGAVLIFSAVLTAWSWPGP